MAPHSIILAWKIPWTEEPGGLQSMGSLRVRHDWATSLSLLTFMYWRRKWQPTPVFLPGESQGWGSLVGCHLWGHTESDTTEGLSSSIVDLQYCASFKCTVKWLSYAHTHTHTHTHTYPFFLGFFFHTMITECWVEFPVLYLLSILYLAVCIC